MELLVDVANWFTDPGNWRGADGIPTRLREHVWYSLLFGVIAAAIALPVGVVVGHIRRGGLLVMNLANIGRAVPTFGVILLVGLYFGFGLTPALVALVALAIPPMLTNAYTGVTSVEADVRDAAEGVGMTGAQVLWRVELPVAVPLLMAGVRTSIVQLVATVTLAAWAGLNSGLGMYIRVGLAVRDFTRVLAAAIMVAALALLTELALSRVQAMVTSRGLAERDRDAAADAKLHAAGA